MAKSRSIGGIYASLSLRDQGFKASLKNAKKSLDSFADGVASFAKGAVLAAPVAAFAGLTASMKSAIDAGGELNDMMARTGAEGEGLFVMQKAFENAGLAASQVPQALNRMQKALAGVNTEGEPTNKAFEKLGLSVSDLIAQDPVAAFKSIQKSISAIEDPAQRTAIAMELFGKSGGEMLAVLTDSGAFEQAAMQVGGLGKTLADNAAALDAVGDSLGQVGIKFQQIGAEVAASLLPQMQDLGEKINGLDFSSIGQGIGDLITKTLGWVEALKDVEKALPGAGLRAYAVEKIFGGDADIDEARKLAAEMSKITYDPNEGATPYPYANLPVPDETESIRWFKNGGFAEAMRSVNGYPTPSEGVPVMIEDPNKNFSTELPEWLKRAAEIDKDPDRLSPREVNAYQARGLSLGGNSAERAVETTNTLLGKIDKRLADMQKTGGAKF
jgi:hypothetical protein